MDKHQKQILLEKPNARSGVYIFYNLFEKSAYVGETNDFYRRFPEHILSHFGDMNASNDRMMQAEYKKFVVFSVIDNLYQKTTEYSDGAWLIDETVVMYILREKGVCLYNGKKNGDEYSDNLGKKRNFLMDHVSGNLKEKVIGLLHDTWELSEEYIERLICQTTDMLTEKFKRIFQVTVDTLVQLSEEGAEEIWTSLTEDYQKRFPGKAVLLTEENYREECNVMLNKAISISDLKDIGIDAMRVEEFYDLIDQGAFDRFVISKFGNYLDQSTLNILSIKQHDIAHCRLSDLRLGTDAEAGICLWGLRRFNADKVREHLGTDRAPRYVMLLLTPSKNQSASLTAKNPDDMKAAFPRDRQEAETMEDYRCRLYRKAAKDLFGYARAYLSVQDNLYYRLPETMFPLVLDEKEKLSALMISKMKYMDVSFDNINCLIAHMHTILITNGAVNQAAQSFKGETSHVLATLKKENRDKFKNYLDDLKHAGSPEFSGGAVSVVIGKLEYPYIIRVSSLPSVSEYFQSEKPKIIIETAGDKKPRKNSQITRVIALQCEKGINKAWIFADDNLKIGNEDFADENTNAELMEKCREEGVEGTFTLTDAHVLEICSAKLTQPIRVALCSSNVNVCIYRTDSAKYHLYWFFAGNNNKLYGIRYSKKEWVDLRLYKNPVMPFFLEN